MRGHDERDDYDDEPWRKSEAPDNVRRVANALWWFGLIQLVVSSFGVVFAIGCFVSARVDGEYGKYKPPDLYWMGALSLAGVIWNCVLMWAAGGMARGEGYRRSFTAAILGVLPIPCAYLGMFSVPVGIYALVLLRKPDVRARFAAVARRSTATSPTRPLPEGPP